jgi:N12 class adenine-specific DNA methylase
MTRGQKARRQRAVHRGRARKTGTHQGTFKEWVWSDDSRRERLCRLYNDTFNHTRVRTFNGEHLTLPGASGAIQLHAHQKAGVWRILQTPNTLLAHVVGAGKTYTMVAAAMESKRLGFPQADVCRPQSHARPVLHRVADVVSGRKHPRAGKEDFESQNRKKLFSRIATGNWDAVIVTHSGFERIPLSRETQERFFKEQLGRIGNDQTPARRQFQPALGEGT